MKIESITENIKSTAVKLHFLLRRRAILVFHPCFWPKKRFYLALYILLAAHSVILVKLFKSLCDMFAIKYMF